MIGKTQKLWIGLVVGVLVATGALFWVRNNGDSVSQKTALAETTAAPRTIAVLPFVNKSADPEQEYFADGFSEDLLNMMAGIKGLRVTARFSSFSFKGTDVAIPEIGKRLNVEYVLQGSMRKDHEKVHVIAQLMQASDGSQVWSQTYDRDDIFAIQDAIAADVVKQLQITLIGNPTLARKTTPVAYALYLQAVQLARQPDEVSLAQSDALLQRVLDTDPSSVPAWVTLGNNFARKANNETVPFKDGYAEAKRAFNRAIELDPVYAPAHAALAHAVMVGDKDPAGAATRLERALLLDPSELSALGDAATLLASLGRLDESLALREEIARRDPLHPTAQYNLGIAQLRAGQLDNAITTFWTTLTVNPYMGVVHGQMGIAMLLKGDASGALTEFETQQLERLRLTGPPLAYHALGRKAESDSTLAACIEGYRDTQAFNIATVYAYRGEPDKAFEWLEHERQTTNNFAEILSTPLLNSLHDDPRWLPFLRTIGKAPEQIDKIQFKVTLPNV